MPSAARRCCAARSAACRPTPTATATARREAWRRALAPDLGAAARRRPLGRQHRAHRDLLRAARRPSLSSSCRRPSAPRTISTSSPRSRTPPRSSASRCSSKAIRRPVAIRACSSFSVTPDPGVIEVNIHPSASWRELVDKTEIVYEEARTTRLGAQKFMIDGRHTGTGGGNHVTLGGPSAADSPLLRRPDLLKSLFGYWLNHPVAVLPVLRPVHRPDQPASARRRGAQRRAARARDRLPPDRARPSRRRPGWSTASSATSWSTPPATRTAPSSASTSCSRPTPPSGRRGLLELRAFEMPPHWRMSVAQQALLRGLVARFWDRPYEQHADALGHAPARRFHAAALRLAGFLRRARRSRARPATASSPTGSRRISSSASREIGEIAQRGIELELRHALEPWHVLGEEPGGGGTVRYVDSSVERLQVKVDGPERRSATSSPATAGACRCAPPARPANTSRACATAPGSRPTALHPTIGVHAPLIFDIHDTLERPLARRLHLSRRPSRRPQLRPHAGQRQRGRGPPPRALLPDRPFTGRHARAAADRQSGASADAGSAAGVSTPPPSFLSRARGSRRVRASWTTVLAS